MADDTTRLLLLGFALAGRLGFSSRLGFTRQSAQLGGEFLLKEANETRLIGPHPDLVTGTTVALALRDLPLALSR